ncbi:DUF5722 domain-containing protein [Mumia sp. DW29H23]|uniref:DUF5722 domain-containing protein n=1 Tax=Mumia sp. DW29H23 TaxID=3421241 RepID=UPI003D684936
MRALVAGTAAAVIAALVPAAQGPALGAETAPEIAGVTYGAEQVEVRGVAAPGETVAVTASSAATDAGGATAEGTASVGADGTFRAVLPRVTDAGTDLRYAQFVAAAGGVASPAHFVDDVTAPARADFPPTPVRSKKGLQVQLTDDAEDLGVQSAAINVSLGQIMWTRPGTAAETVEYVSGGRTFWFSRSALESLDRQIRGSSEAGSSVDLIILVYRSGDSRSAASVLTDPGAGTSGGTVMGFNTKTPEGVAYLTAAMELLADRYTREDRRYGRADGFIMGNEVDAQWEWSHSGDKPLDAFLDGYARALRIGWLATTKFSASARTYVSMTHSWTRPSGANPDEAAPTRYYAGRDLLDGLAALSGRTGDFPWHVAYHPYPQDLFDPTVWDDPDATDSPDAPVVTFRNLNVLTDYLQRPALTYDGAARRVILSEQGCNTRGSDEEAERLQAACYAYAYYRSRFLPGIDSFILHRHVDHGGEGGLNLGLWARDTTSANPAAPLRPKLVYDVFRDIDTARSLEATAFAKDVIGIDDWSEVIPGFDPAALAERPVTRTVGSGAGVRPVNESDLTGADFAGWTLGHNVSAATVTETGWQLTSGGGTFDQQWRGIGRTWDQPFALRGRRWLTAALAGFADEEVVARLRVTTATGQVVQSDARLPSDGSVRTVAADLGSLLAHGRIAKVQVWVRGTGSRTRATTVRVVRVGLTPYASPSTAANLLASGEIEAKADLSAVLRLHLDGLDARGQDSALLRSCGGWEVPTTRIDLRSLHVGRSRTLEVPVDVSTTGSGAVCLDVGDDTVAVPVAAPRLTLEGFESGASGWAPGDHVSAVSRVGTLANGPGRPYAGAWALEAVGTAAAPGALRTVTRTFTEPLDLSAARALDLQLNAYGGATGATGYRAVARLTAADGTTREVDVAFSPDRWNTVSVPLADWSGSTAITGLTVGMRAVGSTLPAWAPRFQVDELAVSLGR